LVWLIRGQFAIGHRNQAHRITLGERSLVSNYEHGHSLALIELANQIHDFGAGTAVEVSGRLVGQKNLGLIDNRTS
jgi:hypothetical protein